MKFFAKPALLFMACLTLNACAGGARSDLMTVTPDESYSISSSNTFFKNISVENITGGKETNPMLMSKVDNTAFQQALQQSLEAHNLQSNKENAPYILDAELLALEQPIFGLTLTVDSVVAYKVKRASNNSVVFNETIKASADATFGDSALAVERLRIANEKSIQSNIRTFIDKLLKR